MEYGIKGNEVIITNEPTEYFEVRATENDAIGFIFRQYLDGRWGTFVRILNRREALKTNQAISEIILGKGG